MDNQLDTEKKMGNFFMNIQEVKVKVFMHKCRVVFSDI